MGGSGSMSTCDSLPILKSQRGMILVLAILCYTLMILSFSFGAEVPESALALMGTLLTLGFGFYFKDKNLEKLT